MHKHQHLLLAQGHAQLNAHPYNREYKRSGRRLLYFFTAFGLVFGHFVVRGAVRLSRRHHQRETVSYIDFVVCFGCHRAGSMGNDWGGDG